MRRSEDTHNRLMLDQAIKQNSDLPISELVGDLPSIECVIQSLKGGRPAGALKSVTVGFSHPFATEKEANVRLVLHYLPTFTQSQARDWAKYLLSHTHNYDRLMESKPEFSVKSSGKKWRANGGSLLFDTKQQAIEFHIRHTVNFGEYQIKEGV